VKVVNNIENSDICMHWISTVS